MSIISLTTCGNIIEANMAKNILENEGIECFLTNENFTTLMPHYNNMLGAGIQIMIDEKDYEKANLLIANQSDLKNPRCPICNSNDVSFGLGMNRFKKIAVVFFSLLSFIPFNNIRNTYYCNNCKADFRI